MPSPADQPALTVLCIDDQEDGLAIRKIFLETFGYRVLIASNGPDGLRHVEENDVHAVLLDYRMPEMDGEEVARALRSRRPSLPILILTGYALDLPPSLHALVDGVIAKGSRPTEVLEQLRRVLGRDPEKPATTHFETTEAVSGFVTGVRKQVQRSREYSEQVKARMPRKSS